MRVRMRLLIICLMALSIVVNGCSVHRISVDDVRINDKNITSTINVVIDDSGIKGEKYSTQFIDSLKDLLSNSFHNVTVNSGYNEPKVGELIIKLSSLRSVRSQTGEVANATTTIDYSVFNKSYRLDGDGHFDGSGYGLGMIFLIVPTFTLNIWTYIYFQASIPVNDSINNAAIKLNNQIVTSKEIFDLADGAILLKTSPANLSLTAKFSDSGAFLPNNTLDAGESAEMFVSVKNTGKGTGFATVLDINAENSKIVYEKEISVGDIQPGEEKEIKVKLKAGLDIADGKTLVQLNLKEKRGYDSKRVIMNIPTAALERPDLLIAGYRINDGNTGFASGNGNGIPENGETVEIVPLVKNNGVGRALRIKVAIASVNNGIEIKEASAIIPEIAPGETASVKLALYIPTTYSGGAITVKFNAVDVRSSAISSAERQFSLNTEVNRPVLAYSWRLLDRYGREKEYLNNGEEGEIEISPRNTGKLEARNVNIAVNSGIASFDKSSDNISRIAAHAEYAPIRFPFAIPRAFEGNMIEVMVRLEQKDFPGLSDPRSIPVRLVKPELRISHQVLSLSGSNALKQGESAEVVIRVDNTGQLDAELVMITLEMNRKGVLLRSAKEVNLGRIETGKSATARFNVDVQRSTEAGSLPVQVSITQKVFASKIEQIAMAVLNEQDEIINVQGDGRPKPVVAAESTSGNMPPVIVVAQPRDNTSVASESIRLSGITTAANGVLSMEIRLNGRLLNNVNRGVKVVKKDAAELSEKDINEQIPLQPGKNEITITVYDNRNLSKTKSITVFRETKKGNVYAAVIGLNKYKEPGMNLKYARNDAEAFASYMKDNMGLVRDQNLFELYDEKATARGIKSLLGTKLRQLAKNSEDTVYIYFAGHGAPEQDSSAQDDDRIRKYLLAYDMEPNDLYGTTIPMDEIAKIISSLNADRVIFIMDACYSGEAGGRTMLAKGMRAVLSEDFLNRMAAGKGRIILTSSKPNETSQEDDHLQHGYFTYNLLEGLKGKADYNGDGIVDIDEIAMYLNKTVPEQTHGKQHPVKKGEAEGQVIIGKVR